MSEILNCVYNDSTEQHLQIIREEPKLFDPPLNSSKSSKEKNARYTSANKLDFAISLSPRKIDKSPVTTTIRRQAISPIVNIDNFMKFPDTQIKAPVAREKTRFINIKHNQEVKTTYTFKEKFKLFLEVSLDNNIELSIMCFLTIFCLFGTDLKELLIDSEYDNIFNGVFIFVMSIFFLEFCASTWAKNGYIYSFFFWLDLMATISMILEVDWVLIPLVDFILK